MSDNNHDARIAESSRREFLLAAAGAAGIAALGVYPSRASAATPITLPALPYPESALQPVISANTLGFHYGKHHQTYVDNLNKLNYVPKKDYESNRFVPVHLSLKKRCYDVSQTDNSQN